MSAMGYGDIAQLGERLNRIQEVSGSIPLISTKRSLIGDNLRGYSSAGRAPALQAGGQRFDSAYLHHFLFISVLIRGYSSAGRAPALQAGGQRFDPAYLHQRDRIEAFEESSVSI